jgi:hypothetical protein
MNNGERIDLPPAGHLNVLLEDVTLAHASPNIVGRCGVVLFKQQDQAWWPLVEASLSGLPAHLHIHQTMLLHLYRTLFSGALEAVELQGCDVGVGGVDIAATQGHLHLMRALLLLAPTGHREKHIEPASPGEAPSPGRRRRDSTHLLMEHLGLAALIEVPGAKAKAVQKMAHANQAHMVGADGGNSVALLRVLSQGGFQAARDQVRATNCRRRRHWPCTCSARTAMQKLRIGRRLGFGTGRQKMVLERSPTPTISRGSSALSVRATIVSREFGGRRETAA